MSDKPNKMWAFRPALSLALVVAGLYMRRPDFRNFVDEKWPWVKENLGKYALPFDKRTVSQPTSAPDFTQPSNSPMPAARNAPGAPLSYPRSADPDSEKPAFDLQRVCSDPALWPKTVALKRNVYFPAVLDGKEIGTLRAPKGSEARLVTIQRGKLGLEYRGGGAWIDVDGTDFEERVRLAMH